MADEAEKYPISGSVLTAQRWATNAELIEDVARLGYLHGRVLDLTYGYGTFWKNWRPDDLTTNDLQSDKGEHHYDFRKTPWGSQDFDSVVFDPPYKLNGTPTEDVDERYGVNIPARWQDRMALIYQGFAECLRLTSTFALVKCMDQVVSRHKVWQPHLLTTRAELVGWRLEDRFDMLVTPRPQPKGRRQVHAQSNYSTLLVFENAANR